MSNRLASTRWAPIQYKQASTKKRKSNVDQISREANPGFSLDLAVPWTARSLLYSETNEADKIEVLLGVETWIKLFFNYNGLKFA